MIPAKAGHFAINAGIGLADGKVGLLYKRTFADGDATGQPYFQDPKFSDQDFFELTSFDTVQRTLSGRFDVHLTDSLFFPLYPSYVHLANGVFDLKY